MENFNVRLGKSKNAEEINLNNMNGGIKKEQDISSEYGSIFDALERHYANDAKYKGYSNGMLEQQEIEGLKQDIQSAKGDDNILSRREAKQLLKKLGLDSVKVETFFNFIKNILNVSANIEESSTDTEGNTTNLYKAAEDGTQVEETYDRNNNLVKTKMYNSEKDKYEIYDNKGRLIEGKDEEGEYTKEYLENGNYKITRGETYKVFDSNNKEISGKNKEGEYTKGYFNDGGYRVARPDGNFLIYDSNDKIIGGNGFQREYSAEGNGYIDYDYDIDLIVSKWTEYNEAGQKTKDVYTHSIGRTSTETYEYNEAGQITKVVYTYLNGRTSTATYEYNEAGQKTKMVDNRGYCDTYEYNEAGQMTQKVETYPDGHTRTTTYEYNEAGQMTKEVYTDSDGDTTTTTYEYNEAGQKTKEVETDSAGRTSTETYEYNEAGQMTKKVDSWGNCETYEYNEAGQMTKEVVTNSDGSTRTQTYDKFERPIATVKKDKDGNITGKEEYSYDKKRYKTSATYDSAGNVTEKKIFLGATPYKIKTEDSGELYTMDGRLCAKKNKDGSWNLSARNGEHFAETMARIGITRENLGDNYEKAKELFTKANQKAANRSHGGWFIVGKTDVNIPAELANMLDFENNHDRILVDTTYEISQYKNEEYV